MLATAANRRASKPCRATNAARACGRVMGERRSGASVAALGVLWIV
uniref:Uncharacterized protein n=1 Tax=Arundo donax TaxID=35708 RepID=A0A0A8Y5S6_ARUDO